jgi:hypothetical protein
MFWKILPIFRYHNIEKNKNQMQADDHMNEHVRASPPVLSMSLWIINV